MPLRTSNSTSARYPTTRRGLPQPEIASATEPVGATQWVVQGARRLPAGSSPVSITVVMRLVGSIVLLVFALLGAAGGRKRRFGLDFPDASRHNALAMLKRYASARSVGGVPVPAPAVRAEGSALSTHRLKPFDFPSA